MDGDNGKKNEETPIAEPELTPEQLAELSKGPEIIIRLDPQTHQVSMSANMPDEILMLGMLELAKVAFLAECNKRKMPRIAMPPPGLRLPRPS